VFLLHAYETVPFYREWFDEAGLHPRDVARLDDLGALPILSKAVVQERRQEFLSTSIPRRRWKQIATSGSTGSGLTVTTTIESVQEQWATWWRYWRWHGIERGTWSANFGSPTVVPLRQKTAPFWRYNVSGRETVFSKFHTSPENIKLYIAELRRKKPLWLRGDPSQLTLIASYIVETGADLGYEVRWITTSSENLLSQQALLIEKAFGVKPKQHFGMVEAIANLSECEKGRLHVDEELGAVEFVPITDSLYRVIGTNLSNPVMPLIRYECNDHVTIESEDSCQCGRPGRVVTHIDGRQEDYIVLKNGIRLGRLDRIFYGLSNVREAQIRQERVGEIRFIVRRGVNYGSEDDARLRAEIATWIRDESKIVIEYVEEIERTERGKLRFVVSTVLVEETTGYELLPPPALLALENLESAGH
jgi:phenylacetate-CoA ligase